MCGIVGIISDEEVSSSVYESLTVIQHRGQDAAGIATLEDGKLHVRKQIGLVRDVFRAQHIAGLKGKIGIGHVRYPTAGGVSREFSQPLYVNSPYGISICHNGNLVNAKELSLELFRNDLRHLNTDSDSEVILNIFAHELQKINSFTPKAEEIFLAVQNMHKRLKGAYSIVLMISGVGLLAIRDPNGIRPLIMGKKENDLLGKTDYMFASESPALDALDFEITGDLKPGEAVFVSMEGEMSRKVCHDSPKHCPCIFEYVYLARPDAVIEEISVMKSRLRMGQKLGKKIKSLYPESKIDSVIPIPESSTSSAIEVAKYLGVNYREGFVKNRYIGRTFIMPKQEVRKKSVRRKLNPIPFEFKDKNILLIDDSIVRGTTSREIVEMARNAGVRTEVPGCSLCIGNQARVEPNSTVVSTSTRNFPNRLGDGANVYLASAELAAISAILGKLPNVDEYLSHMKEINTMSSEIFRYMNFNEIEAYKKAAENASLPSVTIENS